MRHWALPHIHVRHARTQARAHEHEQCSRDADDSVQATVIDTDTVLATVPTDYEQPRWGRVNGNLRG